MEENKKERLEPFIVPPSLLEGDYYAGLTLGEMAAVLALFVLAFVITVKGLGADGIPLFAIPTALFFLFRRREEHGAFVNGAYKLRVYCRYTLGQRTFVLKRALGWRPAGEEDEPIE